jgi:hypothetical protein
MRFGVPFIAIDQIEGGAKVSGLLAGIGWPHVYRIEQTNVTKLGQVARDLLRTGAGASLFEAREAAVVQSNRTLLALDAWLGSNSEAK